MRHVVSTWRGFYLLFSQGALSCLAQNNDVKARHSIFSVGSGLLRDEP